MELAHGSLAMQCGKKVTLDKVALTRVHSQIYGQNCEKIVQKNGMLDDKKFFLGVALLDKF